MAPPVCCVPPSNLNLWGVPARAPHGRCTADSGTVYPGGNVVLTGPPALHRDGPEYRWHPWDAGEDVARGHDAIVAAWLEEPDATGTYTGEYRPPLVSGDDAIAVGISRYYSDSTRTSLESEFHNLWVRGYRTEPARRVSPVALWRVERSAVV